MALINTLLGPMDDVTLLKREDTLDNENEQTTSVEYCLRDCAGIAHRTGHPQGVGFFCEHHIHRSVAMHLKRGVMATSAVGGLG